MSTKENMWPKHPFAMVIFLGLSFAGYKWYQGDTRHGIYFQHILPLADVELSHLPISEAGNLTYEQYRQIHLGACYLNAELMKAKNDKSYEPFSDQECVEMMDRSRPFALKLKAKMTSNENRLPSGQ